MSLLLARLEAKLAQRRKHQELRVLPGLFAGGLQVGDFVSNDYLGFARSPELHAALRAALAAEPEGSLGATGSRLLSGNSQRIMALETELARLYKAEAGLLFNSGYALNSGLFAALAERGDALILDERAHVSLKNGARLSPAAVYYFRHNDCEHLREKLERLQGKVQQLFIVVESIYSMDGDLAPLRKLVELAEEFAAALIVDEAHGIGTIGPRGEGLVVALGLEQRVFARVHTFGKALGVQGAVVLGAPLLRESLLNFCHSFIYTTAMPGFQVLAIALAHQHFQKGGQEDYSRLQENRQVLVRALNGGEQPSPIFSLRFASREILQQVWSELSAANLAVMAILSPTVRRGEERLRIIVHSFNSREEIEHLGAIVGQRSNRCTFL